MRALELLKNEKIWQFIKLVTNLMMTAVHRLDLRDIGILMIYLWMLMLAKTMMMKWIF
jgi:hypothetical protein